MGLFKALMVSCILGISLGKYSQASQSMREGRLFLLINQGDHTHALQLYLNHVKTTGQHDFEVLHQIALGILDYGSRQKDPEIQLLTLFGASIAAREEVFKILEKGLKNSYPQIQLIALNALARLQNDRADQVLQRALGSPHLPIRFEALYQLCLKQHPQAINQIESLMYKTSSRLLSLYPTLLVHLDTPDSLKLLRRLLNHHSEQIRVATILKLIASKRDDLLPQIRQLATHVHFAQQEACAYAFGQLKDEEALPKLEKLTLSQYPTVAIAAQLALYTLGQQKAAWALEQAAKQEDLFAIAALGHFVDRPEVLLELVKSDNCQIRLNAALALLQQKQLLVVPYLREILVRDQRDMVLIPQLSPGGSLKIWKVVTSAGEVFKNDPTSYHDYLELRESILEQVRALSETAFIEMAEYLFAKHQNELVPVLVELLEEMNTPCAIECLQRYQQTIGAPLIRHYCNLALYRLQEEGPYGEQLRKWVKNQSQTALIQFGELAPWRPEHHAYNLTPEESSRLLVEAFEAFALYQDIPGIETLIEAIANGHSKNKYALAGLLLRASE